MTRPRSDASVATYARAIETKDLALFRFGEAESVVAAEQRRIEDGFRAVSSQRVDVTILAIERRGQEASVRLRRRDTIEAGGRQQTTDTQQTMTLITDRRRAGSSATSAASKLRARSFDCGIRRGHEVVVCPGVGAAAGARASTRRSPTTSTAPVKNLATLFTDLFGPSGSDRRQRGDAAGRAAALGALQQRLPVQLQPVQAPRW